MQKTNLKKDKYREARGGYSRFLEVSCHHCEKVILTYQKDGPGELKRMYFDRIIAPEHLSELQNLSIKDIPELICPKCKYILAIPYVYPKEKRNAYRLFVGAVNKKVTKLKKA
jgi:phage FluMu protein Com